MCNQLRVPGAASLLAAAVVLLVGVVPASAQQSVLLRASVPAVNTASRAQTLALYRHYYLAARPAPGWTGSVAAREPGTLSDDFLRATLRRVNYFRAMSGLRGDVVFDAANNALCQQAALMMAAERKVSHRPAPFWAGYTPAAALAAAHSDLCLNWSADLGPGAVDLYMADGEPGNAGVGHRRWLLCPGTGVMGVGIVPALGREHPGANALWVQTPPPAASRAEYLAAANPGAATGPARGQATAWPPAGFVPAPLVFARWSFSYANADFRSASVRVTKNGVPLPVALERPEHQTGADGDGAGAGLNTLVWTLPGNVVRGDADESYEVRVYDVRVDGARRVFDYPVVSMDTSSAGGNRLPGRNDLAPDADPAVVSTMARR